MIQIRINDPRSLGSWCIKGIEESTLGKDSSVTLLHHDPSDLGSLILIWIIPKEDTRGGGEGGEGLSAFFDDPKVMFQSHHLQRNKEVETDG